MKSVLPLIRRSEELAERQPVVSWYCKYYAVKLAIRSGEVSPVQIENWLLELEQAKEHQEIPTNEEGNEASKIVSVYGLSLFRKANEQLAEGVKNKNLGRLFKAAADVLEVLRLWDDEETGESLVDESLKKVILFSKQQAAQLLTECSEEEEEAGNVKNVESSKEQELADAFANQNIGDVEEEIRDKSARNMNSRLGKEQNNGHLANEEHYSHLTNHRSNNQFSEQNSNYESIKQKSENERFFSQSMEQKPIIDEKPIGQSTSKISSSMDFKSTIPSLSNSNAIAQAQKFARYATSALQFDDIETAKSNLRSALSLLESLE